jgi:Fe2+ or Zn2+ uptake regulation protein
MQHKPDPRSLCTREEAQRLFTEHGVRPTPQRIEVYLALYASCAHPTAEELHRLAKAQSPTVSLATIYNTLDALERAGLCRRMLTRGAVSASTAGPRSAAHSARFDAHIDEHVHLFAHDGTIHDLPSDLGSELLSAMTPELLTRIERVTRRKIGRVSVEVHAGPSHGHPPATVAGST